MYLSIPISFGQDDAGEGYEVHWLNENEVTIIHPFKDVYFVATLDNDDNVFLVKTAVRDNETVISFPEEQEAFDFKVNLLSGEESSNGDSDGREAEFYSGTIDDVMLFCKSLDISGDRLASLSQVKVEHYQRIVDEAIDGYLCEYYFTPLQTFNQVQNDGSVRRVFPGKIRLLAIQWVAGLMLQSEFQNFEPNTNESGQKFIEEAKKEMQQMVAFSTRIPGQRRKHPCPTMPPNLAPAKTNEFIL